MLWGSNHGGIFTWRQSPEHSIALWKDLSLKLIVTRFQRFSFPHIEADLGYCIIWKVSTKNRGLNLRDILWTLWFWELGFDAKPVRCSFLCWWRCGELFWPEVQSVACKEIYLGGLGVGENYVCYVVIVFVFFVGL